MFQEVNNKAHRWLLPFTSGVDLPTIDAALRMAESGGATLVAVSFVVTPSERRSQAVRLELIQQSKDFLEAFRYKALRLSLPIESYEVFTHDVLGSITTQLHDLECESLVLASRGKEILLLQKPEMQQILLKPPVSLVLLRFSPRTTPGSRSGLRTQVLSWMQHVGSPLQSRNKELRSHEPLDLERGLHPQDTSSSELSSLVFVRGRTAGEKIDMQRQKEG